MHTSCNKSWLDLQCAFFSFFSIFRNGLGPLLCLICTIIFVLQHHMKLHEIKDQESKKSLVKYYIHMIIFISLPLILISLRIVIKENHVFASHVNHLISLLYLLIFLPKYYINQNPSLKLYVNCYHHQPPPVLPWQLPKNFSSDSVRLNVMTL